VPELPEVETARRVLERALLGRRIAEVEVAPDEIVLQGLPPEAVAEACRGQKVTKIGRKGKTWWIEFESEPVVLGHLGMSGWIRELGESTIRLREHGQAPFEDAEGKTRFLKLRLTSDEGRTVVLTDGRRLARLWMDASAETNPKVMQLGRDWFLDPTPADELWTQLNRRKAPIKSLLLNQELFAGVGNWIADEALYHAGIAPQRLGASLSRPEVARLAEALVRIIQWAVEVGADSEKYPEDWLFHTRWGGGKGDELHQGQPLLREAIGGRTTAWVPSRQK